MLPPSGTRDRQQLDDEALRLGITLLREEQGNLLTALYRLYMTYRMRFIEERGLMDAVPGEGPIWAEALADARTLQEHVEQAWAKVIPALTWPAP